MARQHLIASGILAGALVTAMPALGQGQDDYGAGVSDRPPPEAGAASPEADRNPTPLIPPPERTAEREPDVTDAGPTAADADSEAPPTGAGPDAASLGQELEGLLKSLLARQGDGEGAGTEAELEAQAEREREINETLLKLMQRMETLEQRERELQRLAVDGDDAPLEEGRDPFAITERLTRVSTGGTEGVQFVPAATPPTGRDVPRMRLRGIMRMHADEKPQGDDDEKEAVEREAEQGAAVAAILEVDGAGVHIVRRGDTVGLHRLGSNAVLKVLSVDRLSVVVEVGSLGQVIVVR